MIDLYQGLQWFVTCNLRIDVDITSISIEYLFKNASPDDKYFALLPRLHKVPDRSIIPPKEVCFSGCFRKPNGEKQEIFSVKCEAKGIIDGSDCLMAIPWTPSEGVIPREHSLELKIQWKEPGLAQYAQSVPNHNVACTIHHVLPIESLSLPFPLREFAQYFPPPSEVAWYLFFPDDLRNIAITDIKYIPYPPDPFPKAQFSIPESNPNARILIRTPQAGVDSLKDHRLSFTVSFLASMERLRKEREKVEESMRSLTIMACGAVVDLRGSSKEAEKRRGTPDPNELTARYWKIAREYFPQSSIGQDPEGLLFKETAGDMVLLLSPEKNSESLIKKFIDFLDRLSREGFIYRAGIHIDDASLGEPITSPDSYGTKYSGPALNYAAKVGDNKDNEALRITEPVIQRLPWLVERFDIKEIDQMEGIDFRLFELTPKTDPVVSPAQGLAPSNFADRLRHHILVKKSRACVGLDPEPARFPKDLLEKYGVSLWPPEQVSDDALERVSACIVEFNQRVIDAVSEYSAAVKPQSAHYERFGYHGIKALAETARYAREKGLMVILDAKRSDIGSTAEKYAKAYLGGGTGEDFPAIPFDAITVSPYLGRDGVIPFMDICSKHGNGIFILVKTSNRFSGDLQDLRLQEQGVTLSQWVASLVAGWSEVPNLKGESGFSAIGAVVGATYPEDIKVLRGLMPHSFFLMPGYGAQGGTAEDLKYAFTAEGLGALISSSRGVTYPCPPESPDFFVQVATKAQLMQEDLNKVISSK